MFFSVLFREQHPLYSAREKKSLRKQKILPFMVGKTFYIHNGRNFKKFSVVRSHVGFKFGEFSFTRRVVKHKIKKKKK